MSSDGLEAIRGFVYSPAPSYPDLSGELASMRAEMEMWRHRAMCAEAEVTARNAANVALNDELLAERMKGEPDQPANSFLSTIDTKERQIEEPQGHSVELEEKTIPRLGEQSRSEPDGSPSLT